MKNLAIILTLPILIFTACTNLSTQEDSTKTYDAPGFTFEYPDSWWMTEDDAGYLYSEDSEDFKMQIYTADFMGPRCSVLVRSEVYTDSNGWGVNYDVVELGVPEDLVEICADFAGASSGSRTAELTLKGFNDEFLAILFYSYRVDEEVEALEEFEGILDTVVLK